MTPEDIVQKFLTRQLGLVYETGGVNRVEVFHASGDTSERLLTLPIESGETSAEDLAASVIETCTSDSGSRNSSQPERYGVVTFIPQREEPVGQCSFSLEGAKPLSSVATFDDSEAPSPKGLIAQQMRHNEQLMRVAMGTVDISLNRLAAENRALREEVERYRRHEDEIRSLKDSLLDSSAERELNQATGLQRAKRMDQIAGMLVSMAPMLLSSFFAKKGSTGQAGDAMVTGFKAFLGELDSAEISGILKSLAPNHQMAMLQMYKTFQEQAKTEDKEKPAILRICEGAA